MNESQTIERLREMLPQVDRGWHRDFGLAIREAIRRLTPAEPPPRSREVRVAVAAGTINGEEYVLSRAVNSGITDRVAADRVTGGFSGTVTHGPVIAIVTLPPATVPEVRARVRRSKYNGTFKS